MPRIGQLRESVERWLEAERDQLFLWVPVLFGGGIAAWFVLPGPAAWAAAGLLALAVACVGLALGRGGRAGRAAFVGGLLVASGIGVVWLRAEMAQAPVLARPAVVTLTGRVERVEPLPARKLVRLRVAVRSMVRAGGAALPAVPKRVRVNVAEGDVPSSVAMTRGNVLMAGATIRLRARLMPPPGPAVPGAYDFARIAWFDGVGATGRAFAPIVVARGGTATKGTQLRERLSTHIQRQAPGAAGGIAAALATGDQGAIPEDDAEAMRRAGLAHLLSVSGLHITAVVGATYLLVLRLLALWPWLALRVRLPLVAAGAGAVAAIGYTLLTGAEVPTIRSCVAALMVLAAMALGREALTLRLVAVGALVVLAAYPQAIVGASFQLSFAAIVAIVALHETPRVRSWFERREEGWGRRLLRGMVSLLLTGVVVEAALIPIGLFHFHKAGVYGAIANIVAIPLTTFVTMPLEGLALLLDLAGLGAPVWWATARSLDLLLWLAHTTAALPGAVRTLPAMPVGAYALIAGGGLWLTLWRTSTRLAGLAPLIAGAVWTVTTPAPDLLVTGDGRHAALATRSGGVALLRDRTGDYVADLLATGGGLDGDPTLLSDEAGARCSRDACIATRIAGGQTWRVLATRSGYLIDAPALIAACREADVVISERRLPRGCRPRWLKLDAAMLRRTGGVAVTLTKGTVQMARTPGDRHPWISGSGPQDRAYRSGGERVIKPNAYPRPGP